MKTIANILENSLQWFENLSSKLIFEDFSIIKLIMPNNACLQFLNFIILSNLMLILLLTAYINNYSKHWMKYLVYTYLFFTLLRFVIELAFIGEFNLNGLFFLLISIYPIYILKKIIRI